MAASFTSVLVPDDAMHSACLVDDASALATGSACVAASSTAISSMTTASTACMSLQRLESSSTLLEMSYAARERLQASTTPTPLKKRMSSIGQVTRRDITALHRVDIAVEGFQFDSSIMEHPEFLIATTVVFQCRQMGGTLMQSRWKIYRSFEEFQGLDNQLRRAFASEMVFIRSPRPHRRRTFFRLHRTKAFLSKRCRELHAYMETLLQSTVMRLTNFLDPRTAPFLRCFCDFDNGFGRQLQVLENQFHGCELCLDEIVDTEEPAEDCEPLDVVSCTDSGVRGKQDVLKRQQAQRAQWRQARRRCDGATDSLVANLLDDRSRNIVMCSRYGCSCQSASFCATQRVMRSILTRRGYRIVFQPKDGATALLCVLFRLQQINDIDRRLYDVFIRRRSSFGGLEEPAISEDDAAIDQLTICADQLREAVSNYGLLYAHVLQEQFRLTAIDLKKKLHAFRSQFHFRVGAMELILLCTMLDLGIKLVTNDHQGTVHDILPLSGLQPLRHGGRVVLTLGYILPTQMCIDGSYLLIEKSHQDAPGLDRRLWLGVEEVQEALVVAIEREMNSELAYMQSYDDELGEHLNQAILDAVWNDCQHNPQVFQLFKRQAQQFGKSRISAEFFVLYLEVAFGVEGAMYLTDFLLHVLPEERLRKRLLRARWHRVRRHLLKRLQGYTCDL